MKQSKTKRKGKENCFAYVRAYECIDTHVFAYFVRFYSARVVRKLLFNRASRVYYK